MPARLCGDTLAVRDRGARASFACDAWPEPPPLPARRRAGERRRPAARLERVEDVGFAEINLHGPPSRPLRVVPVEAAIDAVAGDLERDALAGPAAHRVEDGPAIRIRWPSFLRQRCVSISRQDRSLFIPGSAGSTGSVPLPDDRSPCNVSSGSTSSMAVHFRRDHARQSARGDAHCGFWPSSARMRRTSPSTMPTTRSTARIRSRSRSSGR